MIALLNAYGGSDAVVNLITLWYLILGRQV